MTSNTCTFPDGTTLWVAVLYAQDQSTRAAPGGQIKYGIQPKAVRYLDFTCRKSSCQLEARA